MKTLFALVGMPFSGKSTLLRAIQENTSIKTIAFDSFWQDLEKEMSESEKKTLTYEYVTSLIDQEISRLLEEGFSVAYDSLNDTPDQRERLHRIATDTNSVFKIIFLDTPVQLILERRKANEVAKDRHSVADELFDVAIKKFTPPTDDEMEHVLIFRHDEDINKWVRGLGIDS